MRTHACNAKPCTLTHIALTYSLRGRPAGSATSQQIKLSNRDIASQTCPKEEELKSNFPAPAVGHNEEENEPKAARAAIEETESEADEAEADEAEADAGKKETKENALLALKNAVLAELIQAIEAAKISLKVSSRSPLFLSLPPLKPVNLRVFCSPSHTVPFSWSGNAGLANCGLPSDEPAKDPGRKVLFEGYYC